MSRQAIPGRALFGLILASSVLGAVLSALSAFAPFLASASLLGRIADYCGPALSRCAEAEASRWSSVTPVPGLPAVDTSQLGLAYFSFLFLWFALMGRPRSSERYWHLLPSWLVTIGGVFSLFLLAVMLVERLWCARCVIVHLSNLVLLTAVFSLWTSLGHGRVGAAPSADHDDTNRGWSEPSPTRKAMASLVASILLLLFEFTVLDLIRSEIQTRELGRAVNAYAQNEVVQLALYCEQPLVQIPIRADDPGIGSQASPNTLIVFSDYRCHACREFHDYLEQHLLPQFGDRLRIVFKQRPLLRGSAGASGSDSMQTQSWLAARAASAAARLGGTDAFLRLHRLLFGDSLTLNSERIAGFARQAGVDSRALLRALAAPDHDERIREDIALANRSAGTFVPVIFLNGRRVEHWQSRGFWQRTLSTTDAEPCGDDSRHPQTKSSSSVARTGLATGP